MNGAAIDGGVSSSTLNSSDMTSSVMSSSSALSYKPKWTELTKTVDEIRVFLVSLNANQMGSGFVYFDGTRFWPYSSWSNNHTIQWFVNLRNPNATFDGVKEAFAQLFKKIENLEKSLDKFHPKDSNDCKGPAQKLSLELIEVELVITGIAQKGLIQLYDNYQNSWHKGKPVVALKSLGEKCLSTLQSIEQVFYQKLLVHTPDFEREANLIRFYLDADQLISRRNDYCEHLRQISVSTEKGVVVPVDYILDCKHNSEGHKPTRDALRTAATFINLPSLAQRIPTQNGAAEWTPVRPEFSEEDDKTIVLKEGIVGTCERDGSSSHHLCNLYYRFDADTKRLVLSSAAINTRLKAKEMALVINRELVARQITSRRVRLHQCNSFVGEANLMRVVHAQAAKIEQFLRAEEKALKTFFLHINTSFNAATKLPHEDRQSVKNINIDSLTQLVQFVVDDSKLLLQDSAVSTKPDPLCASVKIGILVAEYKEAQEIVENIKAYKEAIRKTASNKEEAPPDHFDEDGYEEGFYIIPNEDLSEPNTPTTPLLSSSSSLSFNSDESIPKEPKEIKRLLDEAQSRLMGKLNEILQTIQRLTNEANHEIEDVDYKKVILLFQILELLLKSQLKASDAPPISRCTEIELFFLLDRMLNIHSVISCWSGLDRTGGLKSISDGLSHMERDFFDQMKGEEDTENESLVRQKVLERLFKMIVEMDENRLRLFEMINVIKQETEYHLITDLRYWTKTTPASEQNIRARLFEEIDRCYTKDGKESSEDESTIQSDEFLAQRLKDTQYYLEIIFRDLIATQGEATLFSTGVIGFKYHHERSGLMANMANPHPIERFTPFIFDEKGRTIEILQYSSGWLPNWVPLFGGHSLKLTPAGIALTHRLGTLRGS